jgi:dynein heavy chain 1
MQQLFDWEVIILSQTCFQSCHYQVELDRWTSQTHHNLLTKLPQGSAVLEAAYVATEKKIKEVFCVLNSRIYTAQLLHIH